MPKLAPSPLPTLALPREVSAVLDGLPLPTTPAEAWRSLQPATQDALGAFLVAMVLTRFLGGALFHPDDRLLDDEAQYDADKAADQLSDLLHDRIAVLLPELFGPEGEDPMWATNLRSKGIRCLQAIYPQV